MSKLESIAFCPHCGNTAPQEVEGSTTLFGTSYNYYILAKCLTCHKALLYLYNSRLDIDLGFAPFEPTKYALLWPAPSELHNAVPDSISRIYKEAARIKSLAPNAFANQIRRGLEAVCRDRGAIKGTLAKNLQELASRGEIPDTLAEMTTVLRQLGNIGSHAGDEEISPDYVEVIDEFFRAIIEYVYIAPQKVKEFKARLDAANQSQTP